MRYTKAKFIRVANKLNRVKLLRTNGQHVAFLCFPYVTFLIVGTAKRAEDTGAV